MSSYTHCERPTLPSIRTLNLLPASHVQPQRHAYDPYAHPTRSRLQVPSPSRRRVSMSSSTTSRTPSPAPSNASSLSPASPSNSKLTATLVPCASFEDADAVVVIPPPGMPPLPGLPPTGKTLLLTGAALAHLRHPQRQITKGTRLHPYRFARPRRVSASSSSSFSSA